MRRPNYDKFPTVTVPNRPGQAWEGWDAIGAAVARKAAGRIKTVVVIDCYSGVQESDIAQALAARSSLRFAWMRPGSLKASAKLTPCANRSWAVMIRSLAFSAG